MEENTALADQARAFASTLQDTIRRVLPSEAVIGARFTPSANALLVTPLSGSSVAEIPLTVGGEPVAFWSFSFQMTLDSSGAFLKTVKSAFALRSTFEDIPLARLEYDGNMRTAPVSHWQFHGERGAFSHLLARAHAMKKYVTDRPHSLSSVHFPTGGERFRPGMEDFLEFLVRECGVDRVDGWQRAIEEGREIWRRFQMRTVTRDLQAEAAQTLRDLNWTVTPPADFEESVGRAIKRW